ncbi:MAG: site-specific integrase [Chloroflexi bacterium]|nr:site-specific integrase [Chloroflexota bacterium]
MRGHIVKRYRGSYSIVLDLGTDPATGKRRQQWISVKGTKKAAEKRLAELLHQLDTGTFTRPGKTTLADYLEQWLKDYCWPNLAPRTAEGYEYIARCHLVPSLGQIPLTQLKPEHLQHVYASKLSAGLSHRTVRYIHVTLHKALQGAVRLGILARNPADAVMPPRAQRREMHTMSESDIHIFLEFARSTSHYALFYTALFTGMRRSELLALRWSDVDLILCQLSVTRALHHLQDGGLIFRQPKTSKGRRLISLTPSTALLLREHRERQEKMRSALGLTVTDDNLVFCRPDGKPLLPNSISHAWTKLASRTGLKGVRLHDARHSHASLMLKQGVHPKIVQERLGHASIQITLDTYSHVAPGLQQAAANRFDDIVIAPRNDTPKEIGR